MIFFFLIFENTKTIMDFDEIENLSIQELEKKNLSIKLITKWAAHHGFTKGLSELSTKKEKMEYLKAVSYEKDNNITTYYKPKKVSVNTLHPVEADRSISWRLHLQKYGWATVPIDGWNEEYVDAFMDWLESCSASFKRNDPSTWINDNLPSRSRGVIKHQFGHTEFQWQIRELCAPIFAKIWKCDVTDLLCSFDGGCFLPSIKEEKFMPWIHVDQPRSYKDRCSVQGIVNFVDNGALDGGLVLVENSKEIFNEYMEKHVSEGLFWKLSDADDPLLSSRRLLKICAKKGELILFDTRMFHCNAPPSSDESKYRMCIYVSMQPKCKMSEKVRKQRIEFYETGRMTSHWCYGLYFGATAKKPNYCNDVLPPEVEIAELNHLRKSLIGY